MTFIVAEIGQNHNGDVRQAHALIEACAVPIRDAFHAQHLAGVDAVKLTKRDLRYEATRSFMAQSYDSPHSYGETYGEHRQALELEYHELEACYHHAHDHGMDFVLTICAPTVVDLTLQRFRPDLIKIASRDLSNGPLLRACAVTDIPIVLSTGMADERDIETALAVIDGAGGTVHSILHCLSQYPAEYHMLNLRAIQSLAKYGHRVGYSDHTIGIAMAPVAVALGARVIEKHVTLSRAAKGSDHAGSLEPDGLRRMVRDIRNTQRALGRPTIERSAAAEPARVKLERSIAAARPIATGEVIDEQNTVLLSPGTGFSWRERDMVYGQHARADIDAWELIEPRHLRGHA